MSEVRLFCDPEKRCRNLGVALWRTWIRRLGRRGLFERPPRVLYRRAGARYFDAFALAIVFNGIVVPGFGVVAVVLYVDLTAGQAALFLLCWTLGFAIEGAVAAFYFLSAAEPTRAWLRRGRPAEAAVQAWSAAAGVPLMLVRRPSLYVIGAVAAAVADVALAALLGLRLYQAAWLFPMSYVVYLSASVLRYVGLELAMRPVLRGIGETLPKGSHPGFARVSLHQRLLATVPMVTWGAALVVGGLVTAQTRGLEAVGRTSLVALGVTAAFSIWLSLVLGDAVSGPIIDLRNATRQLESGDLTVSVPVVSTDETGELAAAFNSMVTGLRERERLREAFGAFVDPALAEHVLTEGTDLPGEEIDASVLFLDVRGFTEFAEYATAQEVVARLNELYDGVVPVIERHGGHANKFMGDALLAVFGAPERHPDHAARAVAAAREIAQLVRSGAVGELSVGLGVNSGRVVIGTIGGGSRRDFTVIGDPVNTAARVEAATRLTGDEILITESTMRALGASTYAFEERPSMPLKGKATTVCLYAPHPRSQP